MDKRSRYAKRALGVIVSVLLIVSCGLIGKVQITEEATFLQVPYFGVLIYREAKPGLISDARRIAYLNAGVGQCYFGTNSSPQLHLGDLRVHIVDCDP